jgi:hypothetical protein
LTAAVQNLFRPDAQRDRDLPPNRDLPSTGSEEQMTATIASKPASPRKPRDLPQELPPSEAGAADAESRLTTRASLMLTLLLSLGLWAAMWALASAVLRNS